MIKIKDNLILITNILNWLTIVSYLARKSIVYIIFFIFINISIRIYIIFYWVIFFIKNIYNIILYL